MHVGKAGNATSWHLKLDLEMHFLTEAVSEVVVWYKWNQSQHPAKIMER